MKCSEQNATQQTTENKARYCPVASILTAILGILCGTVAAAQDLDPRRYISLPTGQNFIALVYAYSEGDVSVSPSVPLEGAFLRVDGPALAYVRTFGIGGKSSALDLQQSYNCVAGIALLEGEPVRGKQCGFADTRIRLTYNFAGAPALNLGDYAKRPKNVVVGASLQVSLPSGAYDNTKLLNIGTNRWYIKPEVGVTVPWRRWSFEFSAGVRFFTDNDEYLGNSKFEQDPLYNLQAHASYDFSPRHAVTISSNYFFGGATRRDGMPSAIDQENSRLGVSWRVNVNARHTVKLVAHRGVVTRVGNDSDAVTLSWTYRWQ